MKIQALQETFDVIYISEPAGEYRVLYCRGNYAGDTYAILNFQDRGMVREVLPHFHALEGNTAWSCYKGCFTRGGELYAVFMSAEGTRFTELLESGALSLERRLQVGKEFLEQLLLWDLPEYFLCQFLDVKRMQIRSGRAEIYYGWDVSVGREAGQKEVNERMADFLEHLFFGEEEWASPSLTELRDRLRAQEETSRMDFFSIYRAFEELCEKMPEEVGKPLTWFERLRGKMIELVHRGKGILEAVLFLIGYVAVVVLFLYGLREFVSGVEEEGVRYESIGTLKIK